MIGASSAAEVPERLVARHDADGLYYGGLRSAAARCLEDDALKPLLGMRVIVDGRGGAGGFFARFLSELGADTEGSLGLVPGEGSAWLDLASADALVPLREAVRAGVHLHGLAGDLCAARLGEYAMTATDLIETLPEATLRMLENKAE